MLGKYLVVVWVSLEKVPTENGMIYGWYETLATALNTATNLVQNGSFGHAVALKAV